MKNVPKSLRKTLFPLFPVLLLLLFPGCKPCEDPTNPECKNYDPCHSEFEVSADFEMREIIRSGGGGEWVLGVTTGKILNRRALHLIARDSGEVTHQWIIGTDPRVRTEKEEIVTFGGFVGIIEITHIVSGPPRHGCFPRDDGRDTVTKTVEILEFGEDMPYYGTYTGVNLHDPDKIFSITIYYAPEDFIYQNERVEISNLPNGCEFLNNILPAGNGFLIAGGGRSDYEDCWGIYAGLGQLSADGDTIAISYRYDDPDSLALTPPKYLTREHETLFLGIKQ